MHFLQDSSIVKLAKNWKIQPCVLFPPLQQTPKPKPQQQHQKQQKPQMPLMFTLHIFQTYLIQHLQLLLRRPAVFIHKKIKSFKPKQLEGKTGKKNLEKFFAPSQSLRPQQKTALSSPGWAERSNNKKQPPLLRRETVACCELDRFAHGQVAGSLLQGHVFEMTLVSWFRWVTATAREELSQQGGSFFLLEKRYQPKKICDLKMDVWRWCFNKKNKKSFFFKMSLLKVLWYSTSQTAEFRAKDLSKTMAKLPEEMA